MEIRQGLRRCIMETGVFTGLGETDLASLPKLINDPASSSFSSIDIDAPVISRFMLPVLVDDSLREITAPSWLSHRTPFIGSRQFIRGTIQDTSPYLRSENGTTPIVREDIASSIESLLSGVAVESQLPQAFVDIDDTSAVFVKVEPPSHHVASTADSSRAVADGVSVLKADALERAKVITDPEAEADFDSEVRLSFAETSSSAAASARLKSLQQRVQSTQQITETLLRECIDSLPAGASTKIQTDSAESANQSWAVSSKVDMSQFEMLRPNLAIRYPFDLDNFQKEAVIHMEHGESVFVAAHTSAGKTVVAEYAIALARRHMTKAIYTSPIKTLSNQKYRDFKSRFGDVGILTGDVQINPSASCLIMTTEILRSMLYRGSDVIRDVQWVIFDEVHYVNDIERGVVWEEVLIMLPPHVRLVLLSATVPNALQFADWIGRTKKMKVHVISTMRRPVPLEHYLYFNGETYKIIDEKKQFVHTGYRQAYAAYKSIAQKDTGKYGSKAKAQWPKLIAKLQAADQLPAVIFCFSKRKCEDLAHSLRNVDLTTAAEKSSIRNFFMQSINRLHGSDRSLPQLVRIRDQLANGVGIHHAGLLPIAKEIVEILFSRGLCKVLFATETFAMGVNMPTRTVVFSSIRKHDGRDFRHLLPGEYTQMSGRAGRRGLDSVGTVILYCESDIHEEHVLQKMILGMPTLLVSQFRLTYNMILNLLRGEGFGVEDMMRRSFAEFDSQRDAPARRSLLKRGRAVMRDMEKNLDADLAAFPQLAEYWESFKLAVDLRTRLMVEILTGKNSVSVLQPGRILVIEHPTLGRTLAILIRSLSDVGTLKIGFRVFALALTSKIDASLDVACSSLFPPFASMNTSSIAPSSVEFLDVEPSFVVAVVRSRANATDLPQVGTANPAQTRKAFESLSEQFRKLSAKLDCYDLVNELRIRELEVVDLHQRLQSTIEHMLSLSPPSAEEPLFATVFPRYDRLMRLKDQLREIELSLLDENLSQMPDFDSRVKVLQELGYIDSKKTVQLKGKVACELNSCDCLMVTELIFDNFLTPLAPEEIICVLSSFVCQEKNVATSEEEEEQKLQFIRVAEQRLVSLATRLGELQVKYGIDTTPADYAKSVLNFSMMTVAYEWACGVPFGDICKMTSILEGSIVRTIVQLEQACREVRDAARVIGDFTLFTKMEQCSIKIKRDIVFAGSLYVV